MKKENSNVLIALSVIFVLLFAAILYVLVISTKTNESSGNNAAEVQADELPDASSNDDSSGSRTSDNDDNTDDLPHDSEEYLQDTEQQTVETEPAAEQESAKTYAAITMSDIESISASSWKSEEEFDLFHRPENLIDGDLSTGWCEDSEGGGIGEKVYLYFDKDYAVDGIYIYPGYHKSKELFEKNGTPIKIRITGDHSEIFYLDDEMKRQKLVFSEPMTTDNLTIEILEVRKGWKYDDTLITEIKLF